MTKCTNLSTVPLVNHEESINGSGSSVMEYPPLAIWSCAAFRCARNGFNNPDAIFSDLPFAWITKSHLIYKSKLKQRSSFFCVKNFHDHDHAHTSTTIPPITKQWKSNYINRMRSDQWTSKFCNCNKNHSHKKKTNKPS